MSFAVKPDGGLLTRSGIESWATAHLDSAAERWRRLAAESEALFIQHRQSIAAPGGTTWEGDAKDAALDRVTADSTVVGSQSAVLREAAEIAENGAHDIGAAMVKAIAAINTAEGDGFRVAEDLSVTDTRRIDVFSLGARARAAKEHAEDIRWGGDQLIQTDNLVGHRLQDKARELANIRFEDEREKAVFAAAGFKQNPPISPDDPLLMTESEARVAYAAVKSDWASYRVRCTSRTFIVPAEQAAFAACVADHEAISARQAAIEARLRELGVEIGPPGVEAQPGGSLGQLTVDDVMTNPQLLAGRTPQEVAAALGEVPGWRVETLGKGSQAGNGWVFRQYNEMGNPTGPQIRWHPGGGHHGSEPYWRVVGPQGDLGGIIR